MLTITDAERAFYESVMEGVLADKPYSLSDLRLAYFLWRLDGGGGGGGGGGAVDSVNGKTGVVVLSASDVGAATTAQGAKADTAVQPAALAGKMGTEAPATFWGVFAVGSEPTPPADGKVHWGFRV